MPYDDRKKVVTTSQTPWDDESWVVSRWRPSMAWSYMAICLFDFIGGPAVRTWLAYTTNTPLVPWESLTLSNGGMFHFAMGAILGLAAWTRGQEKQKRIEYADHFMNPFMGPMGGGSYEERSSSFEIDTRDRRDSSRSKPSDDPRDLPPPETGN